MALALPPLPTQQPPQGSGERLALQPACGCSFSVPNVPTEYTAAVLYVETAQIFILRDPRVAFSLLALIMRLRLIPECSAGLGSVCGECKWSCVFTPELIPSVWERPPGVQSGGAHLPLEFRPCFFTMSSRKALQLCLGIYFILFLDFFLSIRASYKSKL